MNARMIVELMPFAIVFLIIAVFGYFMLMIAKIERKVLKDDVLCTDPERVRSANQTLKVLRLLAPIEIGAILLLVIFAIDHYYHLFKINPVGVGITAGGLLFTYIGILFSNSNTDKKARYTGTCEGVVVGISKNEDSDGNTTYSPVIKYMVNGNEYTCGSGISTGRRQIPEEGTRMNVYYDPEWPKEAESDFERKIGGQFPVWFLAFGIPMILIGLMILTFGEELLRML